MGQEAKRMAEQGRKQDMGSGSDWELTETLAFCSRVASAIPTVYLCNYGNQNAARRLAVFLLGREIRSR